jgi:outer membrane immunogenic protein
MGWDASARARVGYLFTPTLLLYGTGGVAWQNFQVSGTCLHSGGDPFCFPAPGSPTSMVTNSTTRTGWTVGIGLETEIYQNWLMRAEYRYSDFGTFNGAMNFNVSGVPIGVDTYRYSLRVNTQIATFGVGYKF